MLSYDSPPMFRKALVLLALAIMLIPLFTGPAAAQPAVFPVDQSYERTVEYHSSTSYNWIVYNGDNTTYLVTIRTSSAPDISSNVYSSSLSDEFFLLAPGQSRTVNLTVSGKEVFASTDVPLDVVFNFHAADSNATFSVTQNTSSHLLPIGGETDSNNKLLGFLNTPLPYPYNQNIYTFFVNIALWIVISLAIVFILDPVVHHYTKKTKTQADDKFLEIVRKPIFLLIFFYGALNSLEILEINPAYTFALSLLYHVTAIVLLTWVSYRVYKDSILLYASEKAEKTTTELDDTLIPLADKLGSILIWLFGIMTLLSYFGYDLTMFMAGMGILGLVIAFAAQDTLANFFSGIYLLMDRPFKTGDQILMSDGDVYEVRHVGMRSTTLYNVFKHQIVSLPNNSLANNEIVNIVLPDRRIKVNVGVGIAYDADLKKAKDILLEVANSHPHVLKDEGVAPSVSVVDLADSSVNLKVFVWVDDLANRFGVMADIRQEVVARYKEAGIEIPFPQMDVHMRGE